MFFALTIEACEAEHADLLCDVVPGPWCPQSLKLSFQLSPHQQDSVSHGLHIVLPTVKGRKKTFLHYCDLTQGFLCSFCWDIFCWPFTEELRWVQSDGDNASSLRWWIGPSGPDNLLHLGHNSLQVVCIMSHNGEVAHTLIWWRKHMTDDTVKFNIW